MPHSATRSSFLRDVRQVRDIGGGASRPRRFTPRCREAPAHGAATLWVNLYGCARALQHGSGLVCGSCSRLSSEELSSARCTGPARLAAPRLAGPRLAGPRRERARPRRRWQRRRVRGGARRDPAKHAGPRDAWRGPSPATPQGPLRKLELGPRPPEPYELREAYEPEPVPPQPHDLPLPATPRDEPEPGPPENHGPHIHVGHAQPVSSALPPWKSD